jgi:hypothetical protein
MVAHIDRYPENGGRSEANFRVIEEIVIGLGAMAN